MADHQAGGSGMLFSEPLRDDSFAARFQAHCDTIAQQGFSFSETTKNTSFYPWEEVRSYLETQPYPDHETYTRVEEGLESCYPENQPIPYQHRPEAEYTQERYLKVFAILLSINRGNELHRFQVWDHLQDDRLPISSLSDEELPQELFAAFRKAQWAFCALKIESSRALNRRLNPNTILPFIREPIPRGEGVSSRTYKIKIHPEYDGLDQSQTSSHTYVLKTYKKSFRDHYIAERDAFVVLRNSMASNENLIKCYCYFEQSETFNIILEYANGGTLEQMLESGRTPRKPEQYVAFYKSLAGLTSGLSALHNAPSRKNASSGVKGWHQDLRPANILLMIPNPNEPFNIIFKIADLGLAHFERGDALLQGCTPLNPGTTEYGAPAGYIPSASYGTQKRWIDQSVDVWSLGCIFLTTIAWVLLGPQGVTDFRNERQDEINRYHPGLQDCHCFHDGSHCLKCVQDAPQVLGEYIRPKLDPLSGPFLSVTKWMMTSQPSHTAQTAENLLERDLQNAISLHAERVRIGQAFSTADDWGNRRRATSRAQQTTYAPLPNGLTSQSIISPPYAANNPQALRSDSTIYQDVHGFDPSPPHLNHRDTSSFEPFFGDRLITSPPRSESEIFQRTDLPRPYPPVIPSGLPIRNPTASAQASQARSSLASTTTQVVSSTQIVLPVWSYAEAQRWYSFGKSPHKASSSSLRQRKKKDKHLQQIIPHKDTLQQLEDRDYAFLIDDISDMREHWQQLVESFELFAYLALEFDPDGIDIYMSMNKDEKRNKIKSLPEAVDFVSRRWDQDNTVKISPIAWRIQNILLDRIEKSDAANAGPLAKIGLRKKQDMRPLTLLIFSTGTWQCDTQEIIDAVNQNLQDFHRLGSRRHQPLGIQLIRYGDSSLGKDRMRELDENSVIGGYVDTEPFTGNVLKIMLAGINTRYDNIGEEDQRSPQTSPPAQQPFRPPSDSFSDSQYTSPYLNSTRQDVQNHRNASP